jgi:hypothetical protein
MELTCSSRHLEGSVCDSSFLLGAEFAEPSTGPGEGQNGLETQGTLVDSRLLCIAVHVRWGDS